MTVIPRSVLVVGAGPTGLMLAGELALAGVDVAIVERRSTQEVVGTRARGIHARTIEILDQRGIAERFLSEGQTFSTVAFAWIRMSIQDLPTRHPYGLALAQNDFERILAGWVEELGVEIHRGIELTGFDADEECVEASLSDGRLIRASYLVGCDGGRSMIRKLAAIDFPGWDASASSLIAEAEVEEEPTWGLRHDSIGVHAFSKAKEGGPVGILVTEDRPRNGDATLEDLKAALRAVYGSDYGVHNPTFVSRFTDAARQAEAYRKGRVLLAGDAAHIHYPAGGLGLNLGVQDAVNLGWKLAQVVKGVSEDSLLDTYHSEQHPVSARVLRITMAQSALLGRLDDRKAALREIFSELLKLDEPHRRFAAMMTGLDIRYDLGDGHPLLGRRMPDVDLLTSNGPIRVADLFHAARFVLLDLSGAGRFDVSPWNDRLDLAEASYEGSTLELPAIGELEIPSAILVRPDGHVAWVEGANRQELGEALTAWLGRATRIAG